MLCGKKFAPTGMLENVRVAGIHVQRSDAQFFTGVARHIEHIRPALDHLGGILAGMYYEKGEWKELV